jgi:hypothetical protein
MKNIHILPTDKPSRLLKTIPKGNFILSKENTVGSHWENFNLYITSDEEIKQDWFISFNDDESFMDIIKNYAVENFNDYADEDWVSECEKIILTTDQDLIKDGVQAIEDGFLEWFVKNPSCEYVELKGYAIILPGESCDCDKICSECEAKQEPGKETADYIDRHIVEALVEVAKQKMYSEEDMRDYSNYVSAHNQSNKWELPLNPKEWFEQFKK